jgi:hypothetical protein
VALFVFAGLPGGDAFLSPSFFLVGKTLPGLGGVDNMLGLVLLWLLVFSLDVVLYGTIVYMGWRAVTLLKG